MPKTAAFRRKTNMFCGNYIFLCHASPPSSGVVGWCDGAGQTSSTGGQGPSVIAVGAGGGCLDIFLSSIISLSFSLSLWETARYRLKYCLKGPLAQNNQPFKSTKFTLYQAIPYFKTLSCLYKLTRVTKM